MNMISRLLWSIRNRDWGSAMIEIFVVAVGILMALAVDNWRTQLEESKKEHEILKRAHQQVQLALEELRLSIQERLDALDKLYEARRLVFGVPPDRSLTEPECRELIYSHNVFIPDWPIPALEELLASGSLSAIKDSSLRTAGLRYLNHRDLRVSRGTLYSALTINLPQVYPDLLPIKLEETDDPEDRDGLVPALDCNLERLRESQEFANALYINVQYTIYAVERANAFLEPSLSEFHDILDSRLGMQHQ
jgi:hypothetical protein